MSTTRRTLAQTPAVPPELQVGLISKLLPYDRNFVARAGALVRILVLVKPGGARSMPAAEAFKSAVSSLQSLGGLPHDVRTIRYDGADALAKACRAERVAIVYVTPDLEGEIDAIQAALGGVDVLSIAAVGEYVARGVVLGFELVSGKPKILLNLAQARSQNVAFSSQVLKVMRVFR